MKEIELSQNKFALVDDEDYERVMNAGKWSTLKKKNTFYGYKRITIDGKYKSIYLHTFILGRPEEGFEIDHKDNNGLNCIKDNLRFVTHSQNMMNASKQRNCTSIYKGVSFKKRNKIWIAQIRINNKQIHLGSFTNEKLAACCYNAKALELFGEFAKLNN